MTLRAGEVRRSPVGDILILSVGRNVGFMRADGAAEPVPTVPLREWSSWPVVREPERVVTPEGPATILRRDETKGCRVAFDDPAVQPRWVAADEAATYLVDS